MIRDIGRNAGRALLLSVLLWAGLLAGAARADTVTYFHNDIAGTPLAATDEGGNLLWKESYRPYGERLLNQTGPDANRLWFTGKPQDPDTGLSYLGARYYNPQLGRFVGVDPKAVDPEDFHSFNRYAYGNNNPYKFVDPDGKNPLLLVAVGLGLWLGTEILTPMPDVPPGSGMVVPTSLPDLTGALGAAKGLGVAAMAIRSVENTVAKEGAEVAAKSVNALKDGAKLPTDKALGAAIEHLGPGYKEMAPGVFISADGTQMVRMTESDLAKTGNHAGAPHMNFETGRTVVKPNGKEQFISQENKHIFLPEEK